jgi:phosphate transport system ATP-binding protein
MELKPPPVRRLPLEPAPHGATGRTPAPSGDANGHAAASPFDGARKRRAPSSGFATDRMQVDDVSIAYGRKLAVDRVSLPIRQGEILALIGPSGCGKTTLLRSLNRLTELTSTASFKGDITLDGTDITRLDPSR